MKLTVHDVKADGSCFFRSIYHSARFTGNLPYILKYVIGVKTPVLESWNEELFVVEIRKSFASKLLHGTFLDTIYTNLHDLYVNDKATYREIIMSSYPRWFVKLFKRMPHSLDTFKSQYASSVLKITNWVGQIEVEFFYNLLAKKHSRSSSQTKYPVPQLVILNNVPSRKAQLDCKTMYLLNIDEIHFNYILCRKCEPPRAKVLNPETKRCVKVNGALGKRLRIKGMPVFE